MDVTMNGTKGQPLRIQRVKEASTVEPHLPALQSLLQRCVNDQPSLSSIGFFAPLADEVARQYWLDLLPSAIGNKATTVLLLATCPETNELLATVQLGLMPKETHAFKAEVRKLLVHPSSRRHGLGRRMMDEVERMAREELGLDLLVLDTATATPARKFYRNTGWTEWGICPDYAKSADGAKHDCSFFVKTLR